MGQPQRSAQPAKPSRIPIVLVPGVMGSRLKFLPKNPLLINTQRPILWDPDNADKFITGQWFGIGLNDIKEKEKSELFDPLRTDVNVGLPNKVGLDTGIGDINFEEKVRGWSEVLGSVYLSFLRKFHKLGITGGVGRAVCPVYACGYDWRSSNKLSGADLVRRIEFILAREAAQQVIIITHSMGGLVTRAAIHDKQELLIPKVRAVIHVVQPVAGAPVAYRRFFTAAVDGVDSSDVDDTRRIGLLNILGLSREQYITNLAGMRGPIELLPNRFYRDGNQPWLFTLTGGSRIALDGDPFAFYGIGTSPPGLMDIAAYRNTLSGGQPIDDPDRVFRDLQDSLFAAKQFHNDLGIFMHPRTWSIFSTGLMTDMAVTLDPSIRPKTLITPFPDFDINRDRRQEGDSTVPASSASRLFPNQRHPPSNVKFENKQYEVLNVDHGAAMSDGVVQDLIINLLKIILTKS